MAKRCLTSVTIDGVEYPLAQLSSFSFINSSESNRAVYRSNSEMLYVSEKQTDFIPLITPFVESGKGYKGLTDFDASIVNYPYTTAEGQRIAIQFVQGKGTDGTVLSSIGFGYSGNDLEMYVSIVIDDSTQTGYIILAYYINEPSTAYGTGYGMYINGGSNTQGQLIYNIFKAYDIPFGGGAGSGYIGNSLVSNKKMVGYNVPISSAESTKTESVEEASESPESGIPKIGNGHARIKLIREHEEHSFESIIRQTDVTHKQTSTSWSITALRAYFGTDWNLEYDMWSRGNVLRKTGDEYFLLGGIGDYYYVFQFTQEIYITKIEFDLKIPSSGGQYVFVRVIPMYYDDNGSYNSETFILQKNSTASYANTDVLIPLDKNDYGHYSKEYSAPQKASMFRFYFDVGDYYFKNLKIYTV